jgi:hypothetical protein
MKIGGLRIDLPWGGLCLSNWKRESCLFDSKELSKELYNCHYSTETRPAKVVA